MKNIVKKAIIMLSLAFVATMGVSTTSASYYSLSTSDRAKVERTVNNILNNKGYFFCKTSAYTRYLSELNNYANYFERYSRDYNFSKSIAVKLKDRCDAYINRNINRYQNNCYGSTCNNVVSITANRCGVNGCGRDNVVLQQNNIVNNDCLYNNCIQRNYKKGYYVTIKSGIEIRKSGNTMYLYEGNRLVLTYVLGRYESTNFSISKFGGNNKIYLISKTGKYGECIKWIYNSCTNTISKINAGTITKVKKDRYGNYYFIATKNNLKSLYKYNGRTIKKVYTSYRMNDYSVINSNCVRVYYYDYYGYYVSKTIRTY